MILNISLSYLFRFLQIIFATILFMILNSSCGSKVVQYKCTIDKEDTTYFGEYRYLASLDGRPLRLKSMFRQIPPDVPKGTRFASVCLEDRIDIIELMRLMNTGLDGDETGLDYTPSSNGIISMRIHPHSIYGHLPAENILVFDSLKELHAPLCPETIRQVITGLPKLETLSVTVLSNKPYTIDLSGLDMSRIKNLGIHGLNCERIIFPEKNGIEYLGLTNCDITSLDSSFKNLKSLKGAYIENSLIKEFDLQGLDKLDTFHIASAKGYPVSQKSIKNKQPTTVLDIRKEYYFPLRRIMYRDESKQDTLYQKLAAAAGCK